MSKFCPKCQRELPVGDFNWKVKDIRRAVHCKECSRSYVRAHYQANRKYYLDKANKRNIQLRETAHKYIKEYLSTHQCVDCGETDFIVLEFDHRDRNTKSGEISHIIREGFSLNKLIHEVSKCDVRCANCHRRKTAKESNSWKLY